MPGTAAYVGHVMDAVERYQEAWRLLQDRQPRQALAVIEPALEQEPDSVSLRTLRAWAYFKTAQLTHAESDLRRLVDDCPTDVWARFSLGRTLERQSRLSEALTHLRLAYAMSGDTEHEVAVMRVERLLAESTG